MFTLLLSGVHGGVGTTAVAANLAAALQGQGLRCLCLDLNADNTLRLSLAARPEEPAGWARAMLDGGDWRDAAWQHADGRWLLPFGELNASELREVWRRLLNDESPLPALLAQLRELPMDCMVIDAPVVTALPNLDSLAVDCQIVVAAPDSASYTLLKQRGDSLLSATSRILINRLQSGVELNSDIAKLMADDFAALLLPSVIHEDLVIAEAEAQLQPVIVSAPDSQATQDFQRLAVWCSALRMRQRE